jgi:Trypsin-like peptidase domain
MLGPGSDRTVNLERIQSARDKIAVAMGDPSGAGRFLTLAAVDPAAGGLVIGIITPDAEPDARRLAQELAPGLPIVIWCARFRRHGKQQKVRPIRGGQKICVSAEKGQVESGSIGLVVKRGDEFGFVTAGHAVGAIDSIVYQPSISPSNVVGKVSCVSQGATASGTSDCAFVRLEPQPNQNTRRLGPPPIGAIWRTDDSFFEVKGSQTVSINNPVFISGQNNDEGGAKGTVVAVDATVQFTGNSSLSGQILATYKTESGDSGAPVFCTREGEIVYLVGINVGGAIAKDVSHPQAFKQENIATPTMFGVCTPWDTVIRDLGGDWEFVHP